MANLPQPEVHSPPSWSGSAADQTSLPFVNQDVGDDGRFCRLHFTALCVICGFQLLKLLSARRVPEQGAQFQLSLLEGFRLRHRLLLRARARATCRHIGGAPKGMAWAAASPRQAGSAGWFWIRRQ